MTKKTLYATILGAVAIFIVGIIIGAYVFSDNKPSTKIYRCLGCKDKGSEYTCKSCKEFSIDIEKIQAIHAMRGEPGEGMRPMPMRQFAPDHNCSRNPAKTPRRPRDFKRGKNPIIPEPQAPNLGAPVHPDQPLQEDASIQPSSTPEVSPPEIH